MAKIKPKYAKKREEKPPYAILFLCLVLAITILLRGTYPDATFTIFLVVLATVILTFAVYLRVTS